jgi:hypothetical protein
MVDLINHKGLFAINGTSILKIQIVFTKPTGYIKKCYIGQI